jgi:hypothetical protein
VPERVKPAMRDKSARTVSAPVFGALLAGMLVVALSGCADNVTPQPSGSSGAPAPSMKEPTPSIKEPTPSMKEPAPSMKEPTPPTSADPENPQDLRGAPIVVSGLVHVGGGCVELDTGTVTWLLGGPAAAALADGARVTVTGRPMPVPAGCHADRALTVQRIG